MTIERSSQFAKLQFRSIYKPQNINPYVTFLFVENNDSTKRGTYWLLISFLISGWHSFCSAFNVWNKKPLCVTTAISFSFLVHSLQIQDQPSYTVLFRSAFQKNDKTNWDNSVQCKIQTSEGYKNFLVYLMPTSNYHQIKSSEKAKHDLDLYDGFRLSIKENVPVQELFSSSCKFFSRFSHISLP